MSISTITIGTVDYTSYASVAEADAYLAADPVRGSTWNALAEDNKKINLVAATRRLDTLTWKGKKAGGSAQINAWPRDDLSYPDGTDVPDNEVPEAIEIATILLAGTIAVDPQHASHGGGTQRAVSRVKAGTAEVEFADTASIVALARAPLADPTALEYIRFWLTTSVPVSTGFVTGTDAKSSFSCPSAYDRSRGFA